MFFKQKEILMEFKKTKESGIVVKVKKKKDTIVSNAVLILQENYVIH